MTAATTTTTTTAATTFTTSNNKMMKFRAAVSWLFNLLTLVTAVWPVSSI